MLFGNRCCILEAFVSKLINTQNSTVRLRQYIITLCLCIKNASLKSEILSFKNIVTPFITYSGKTRNWQRCAQSVGKDSIEKSIGILQIEIDYLTIPTLSCEKNIRIWYGYCHTEDWRGLEIGFSPVQANSEKLNVRRRRSKTLLRQELSKVSCRPYP